MATALSVRRIEALKPTSSRREIPDGIARGLYLVLQPSGLKSWAFRYRSPIDRRPKKLTIGPYPAFGLSHARELAGEAAREVARGGDPANLRAAARALRDDRSNDVDVLLDEFVARHVTRKNRPSTAVEVKRLIERNVKPTWTGRRIHDITRRDVVVLLDAAVDRGALTTANRLLALVRKFFNWLIERSVLETSPASGIRPPTTEVSRERVLDDSEIIRLWKATDDASAFSSCVRLLLLTGQRRGEVAGMRRSDLVATSTGLLWNIPSAKTKNGRAHSVPIEGLALRCLRAIPRIGDSDLVFTTAGQTQISGWSKGKRELDERMALFDREPAAWRIHDLRRTATSGMARLGSAVHVVEAVLNHQSGSISGVAAVYNRHNYAEEKRLALLKWSDHVEHLVKETK